MLGCTTKPEEFAEQIRKAITNFDRSLAVQVWEALKGKAQTKLRDEVKKVFELNSPKGSTWVESVTSFRYMPTEANKPYTVRKESGKGGEYWYGYRKVAGKLPKNWV